MTQPSAAPTVLNGWDLETLQALVDSVRQQPEAGVLTWRSHVSWDGGFGLDAHADEIDMAGAPIERHFTMRGDHPSELLGQNTGPTAVESLLAALGACVTGTFAAQATARGVELQELDVSLQAQIDLNGFFLLQPIPPGITDVSIEIHTRADTDDATLEEIRQAALKASPVFDSVTRPVAVEARVTRS